LSDNAYAAVIVIVVVYAIIMCELKPNTAAATINATDAIMTNIVE
jgi:hypothetical protein